MRPTARSLNGIGKSFKLMERRDVITRTLARALVDNIGQSILDSTVKLECDHFIVRTFRSSAESVAVKGPIVDNVSNGVAQPRLVVSRLV